jgi:hypothetical protein
MWKIPTFKRISCWLRSVNSFPCSSGDRKVFWTCDISFNNFCKSKLNLSVDNETWREGDNEGERAVHTGLALSATLISRTGARCETTWLLTSFQRLLKRCSSGSVISWAPSWQSSSPFFAMALNVVCLRLNSSSKA